MAMGEMITFDCPGGEPAAGYLAKADGARVGVVVIQEWWGLNDQIKGVADRFAAAGFSALSPDLYKGRVTGDPDEANHMMTGLDWVGATEQDVRGALRYLRRNCEKTAVMGFCMGGALTIIAAAKVPECDAAVCYYGIPPADAADPAQIKIPLQGHFATEDDWCTPDAVKDLEERLKAGGVRYDLYSYEAAHAFFNETVDPYDAAAAARSWDRTLGFLRKAL